MVGNANTLVGRPAGKTHGNPSGTGDRRTDQSDPHSPPTQEGRLVGVNASPFLPSMLRPKAKKKIPTRKVVPPGNSENSGGAVGPQTPHTQGFRDSRPASMHHTNKYNKSQNASSNRCSKAVAVLFCLAGGDMADDDGPRVKAGGVGQHGRHLHRVAHGHL